jgi:hypothetical protein
MIWDSLNVRKALSEGSKILRGKVYIEPRLHLFRNRILHFISELKDIVKHSKTQVVLCIYMSLINVWSGSLKDVFESSLRNISNFSLSCKKLFILLALYIWKEAEDFAVVYRKVWIQGLCNGLIKKVIRISWNQRSGAWKAPLWILIVRFYAQTAHPADAVPLFFTGQKWSKSNLFKKTASKCN